MTRWAQQRMEEAELTRLQRVKQRPVPQMPALGAELVGFFKHSVQKRQTKFGKVADAWSQLVPQLLLDHCCLESFHRGSLSVLVDSASHLYELRNLLLAGLEEQLTLTCRSAGLKKISLKRGIWYDPRDSGKPAFENEREVRR